MKTAHFARFARFALCPLPFAICYLAAHAASYNVPIVGGSGGGLSNAYSFSAGMAVAQNTNVSLAPAISNLVLNLPVTNLHSGNILTVRTNGNNASAQKGKPDKAWAGITNAAYVAVDGDTIEVHPGQYFIGTNSESVLKNGVNWIVHQGARINFGTSGDNITYVPPFNDFAGPLTNRIYGAGIFVVSNDANGVFNITNNLSKVIVSAEQIRSANQMPTVTQGTAGGSNSTLVLILSDGIYSDGYDAYINESVPNASKLYVQAPNVVGSAIGGASSFEMASAFAKPGDGFIQVGYAKGDLTLVGNVIYEIGGVDLGTVSHIYSPLNDPGTGILRNSTVYGASNATVSWIHPPSGLFATAGTFDMVTFIGATNRDIANITNSVGTITFKDCWFRNGFGATNNIRSANAQNVSIVGSYNSILPLHANVTPIYPGTNYQGPTVVIGTLGAGAATVATLSTTGYVNASSINVSNVPGLDPPGSLSLYTTNATDLVRKTVPFRIPQSQTNVIGLAHTNSGTVTEWQCSGPNAIHDLILTNRLGAAISVIVTNPAPGQKLYIRLIGQADTTDRVATFIPHTGWNFITHDTPGMYPTNFFTATVSNKCILEVSIEPIQLLGSNYLSVGSSSASF